MKVLTTREFVRFAEMEREIDGNFATLLNTTEYQALRREFKEMIKECPTRIFLTLHSLIADAGEGLDVSKSYEQLQRSPLWKQWIDQSAPKPFVMSSNHPVKQYIVDDEVQWHELYH